MGAARIITGRGRIEEGQVWESDLGQGGYKKNAFGTFWNCP